MLQNHHFWWRFFPKKELTQVYISSTIRYFAISLISLFIPIYLYKELGYSLAQTLSFFVYYAVTFGIATPFAAKFSARYGIKHSVLVSMPFYIAFLLLLFFLPTFRVPIFFLSLLVGISLAFYWMGMHLVFRRTSDFKHRGEEVGKRESLCVVAATAGPLAGGFLIKFFGFAPVFVLASICLFISVFFLFLSKEEQVRYTFSLRSLIDRRKWKDYLFFISRGTRVMASEVIWPLFIFIILEDYFSLGFVGAIIAGISAVLLWLTGKYSDRIGKRKIVRWSAAFESLSWWIRAVANTVGQIFGITIFGALTVGIIEAPLGALEYDKARGRVTEFFVDREIFICLGRILILLMVLVFDSLTSGLIFQGVVSLAALLF